MKTGLVFLGLGHSHAPGKLSAVQSSPDAELVGVCEPDRGTREQRQNEEPFKDVNWFDTMDELLARDDVVGVIVDGLVGQNVALAEAALKAGKHVLLEKPAGTTSADIELLHSFAADGGLCVQMGYQFRYLPGFTCLRRLVKEGVLGDVFCCRARIGKDKASYDKLEPELRQYAGGTLFELGCHPMDFIIGLMGKPTSVTGFLRTDHREDTPLADNTVAVLEFAGGLGMVESAMMEIAAFAHRRVEVYGTRGTAILQPFDATAVRLTLEAERPPYRQGEQEVDAGSWPSFKGDIEEFVACIRDGKEPEYSAEHDRSVQAALLAACGIEPWPAV